MLLWHLLVQILQHNARELLSFTYCDHDVTTHQKEEVSTQSYKLLHSIHSLLSAPLGHGKHGNQYHHWPSPEPAKTKCTACWFTSKTGKHNSFFFLVAYSSEARIMDEDSIIIHHLHFFKVEIIPLFRSRISPQ